MPRRKFQKGPVYHPHAGTTPERIVTPGAALDDHGKPIRLQNYHVCGAVIFRGMRDFDGAHWKTTYHQDPDGAEIRKCPQCWEHLFTESVSAFMPGEEAPPVSNNDEA